MVPYLQFKTRRHFSQIPIARFQQSMLHSEQVKTGWGGVCTVRSKLNKFEHILGARAGVLYEAVRARVEVAGLGPYKVGLGLGLCTGTPLLLSTE